MVLLYLNKIVSNDFEKKNIEEKNVPTLID